MILARNFLQGQLLAAVLFLAAGCTVEPTSEPNIEEPVSAVDAVVETLATAASGGAESAPASITAEIVDVIDGGAGNVWAVKVDFPNGSGGGCYIDVFDKKTQKLLARDAVRDSPDNRTSHMVQFRYRGSAENLTIQVLEIETGSLLAESQFR